MTQSPLVGLRDPDRPLVSRLLALPRLRARYIAHVRAVIDESFRWDRLGPRVASCRHLLGDAVAKDTRKLYSTSAYERSVEETTRAGRRRVLGLRPFVEARREFLLEHAALQDDPPAVSGLAARWGSGRKAPLPGEAVTVTVRAATADRVVLRHATGRLGSYASVALGDDGRHGDSEAEDGLWAGEIPARPAGVEVRWYVEAWTDGDRPVVAYAPARGAGAPRVYRPRPREAPSAPVRIVRWCAANVTGRIDPQGEHDDWIELRNTTDRDVDLSGLWLTDDLAEPRSWRFPDGAWIPPGGTITVWADGDTGDRPGLHAGFRLGREGESILLLDRDARGNAILDRVAFGPQEPDRPGSR